MRHPNLATDQLRPERVRNRFLSYVAFLLKIGDPQHDCSTLLSVLNVLKLSSSRQNDADLHFIQGSPEGFIDTPISSLLSTPVWRLHALDVSRTMNPSVFLYSHHHYNGRRDPTTVVIHYTVCSAVVIVPQMSSNSFTTVYFLFSVFPFTKPFSVLFTVCLVKTVNTNFFEPLLVYQSILRTS